MRLLVVEDDPDLNRQLTAALTDAGYVVDTVADGEEGHFLGDTEPYDAVILDLGLPVMDGVTVLEKWRRAGRMMPVLILTAKGEEADKVLGFRLGADDYVTKPFGVLELLARVEALLRRTRPAPAEPAFAAESFGDIDVDMATRSVRRNASPVALTPMEFDLLVALLHRKGAVASRIQLLAEVWGHSSAVLTRTVDTHIGELRRKLEHDPANPRHILTVRKAGYRLAR